MTIAYWCLVLSIFIPIGLAGYAKFSGGGKYNNHAPREFLQKQPPRQQRANWAQQNTYEAFPPFAAGLIIAHQVGAWQMGIDSAAIVFLVARIVYGYCYIRDMAGARTLVYAIGFFATLSLFIQAALA